ncbi:MAG TPA: class I SAM-dependent methyltransferase [Thermoanaerobaculia bacterium]|nr:class I SAM-dependent methyltransferase [Thermoanaerobaculia bacterium]
MISTIGSLEGSFPSVAADSLPTREDILRLLTLKHEDPQQEGWAVRARYRHGYFIPDDVYMAVVERHVTERTRWLDVGGGRNVLPFHRTLARVLAERCQLLVGVDPSSNIQENPYVHEKVQSTIEGYRTDHVFDLATLRMVAEHLPDPPKAIAALRGLLRPGGRVIVYTVNRWSPITILSGLTPFQLHLRLKKVLWGGEEKDTFPTCYRMNTRQRLKELFEEGGFEERLFAYLDDCGTFGQVPGLYHAELLAWRALRRLGLRYPENCLLGVYEKRGT